MRATIAFWVQDLCAYSEGAKHRQHRCGPLLGPCREGAGQRIREWGQRLEPEALYASVPEIRKAALGRPNVDRGGRAIGVRTVQPWRALKRRWVLLIT